MEKGDRFYLAHSVELIVPVRRWELHIQGHYNIDLVNPFKTNKFEDQFVLKKLKTRKKILEYMQTLDMEICQMIVEHDLKILRKCDGCVAIFNTPSIGTAQEIFAAHYLYHLPVYVIAGEYSRHPWIAHICAISGGMTFFKKQEFEAFLLAKGLKKEV